MSKNVSLEELRKVYNTLQRRMGLVASEVTFTVDPGKVRSVTSLKRTFMDIVARRIEYSVGLVGYIITRENHENGFPHAHGIVWYKYTENNAPTLCAGSIRLTKCNDLDIFYVTKSRFPFDPLGRGKVYALRDKPYKDGKGRDWQDHLEYICKDQMTAFICKNIYKIIL